MAELEGALAEERAAAGDLASLRERIESSSAALSQRMETLGARERELAQVNAGLEQAKQQLAQIEERQGLNRQRLNADLATLGERERDLAAAMRSLSGAQLHEQRLREEIEDLANTETEKRAILGALDLEVGTLERERSQRATDLAGVQAELQTTRTLLAETQEQLDKALLASSVAELQAREAALRAREAELEARVVASRVFAGPTQFPPEGFAAYGILAFRSAATPQSRGRHVMICEAYVAGLPHAPKLVSEFEVDFIDQMVTVWPVDDDSTSDKLNRLPQEGLCDTAIGSYGLETALLALKHAELAGADVSGIGPYLLAWSPSDKKGKRDALVLVADMSGVTTDRQANEMLLSWSRDIELDPRLWRNGWDVQRLLFKFRLWLDDYGPKILALFGDKE
jgi:hypothetical protein